MQTIFWKDHDGEQMLELAGLFNGIAPQAVRRGTTDVAYNRNTTIALLETPTAT